MDKNTNQQLPVSKLSTAIRYIYYALVIVAPLLMYSGTSELFEFNKILYIYLTASLVISLWFIDLVLHKRRFVHSIILDVTIGLFVITQILSTAFSIDPHTSLFGYYGRFNGGLLSIIAYVVLFYGFLQYFDKSSVFRFLKISTAASFIVILWGLPGKFGHDMSCLLFTGSFDNVCWTDQFRPAERMFSTLGQPNWLGAYLAIHFFIGLYFFFSAVRRRSYGFKSFFIPLIYLGFNFSALLFTRSRSALAATGVCFVLAFLFVTIIQKSTHRAAVIKSIAALCIILAFATILFKTGVPKIDTYITLPEKKPVDLKLKSEVVEAQPTTTPREVVTESFDIRRIVWKGATDLGKQYPLFGTGVETFAYAYYFTRPKEHNMTSEWDFLYNKAHNEYLNYFATTGYIGTAAYGLMIISIFIVFANAIRRQSDERDQDYSLLMICLLLAYITILITNFFGFSTTTINLFFYLIPAIPMAYSSVPSVVENRQRSMSFIQQSLIVLAASWFIYSGIYIGRYLWADILYNTADRYTGSNDYGEAARVLEQALNIRYEHVYEDKLSYTLANLAYIAAYQKEQDLSKKLMDLSDLYNKKTLQVAPYNVLYWKTRAKDEYLFYQTTQDMQHIKEALTALQKAEILSPTDPKIPYSIALFYSLLEDEEKNAEKKSELRTHALEAIEASVMLKTDYKDTYVLKAQLLKKFGNTEEARRTYQYVLDHFDSNDQEVLKELKELQ